MTTAPELDALLTLQDLDTHIDRERHRLEHLAERAELSEIEHMAGEVGSARSELAVSLGEVVSRQNAAERELRATEERIVQVNRRLYGGTVTASRELQAMANDVDGLRKRASELEDRVLGLMEEREPLDAAVAELDKALADLAERRASAGEKLARAEAEVASVLQGLVSRRPAALSGVPAPLLDTYGRLRERLGGVAVARLVGGRCDGCHLSLPAMELDRIRHLPPGSLENCEQCGRILVYTAA
ncbi:MAG TPA: C4-type zinc ribbon domain-containing protein [Acidimicrobiales bacterium]|nr:C4-type zinc ribbon domain-containing protein [Acidimicrobiales bacterium]